MQCMLIFDKDNRTLKPFIEKVISGNVTTYCDFPNAESDMPHLIAKIKAFLGTGGIWEELLSFFSRYREILFGSPLTCDNIIVVESQGKKAVHVSLSILSQRIRKASKSRPVFLVLANVDTAEFEGVSKLFDDWDAILPIQSVEGTARERELNFKSMLASYQRGYLSYLVSHRRKIFWRIFDLLFVGMVAPAILGFFSGFGEGVGQTFYNSKFVNSAQNTPRAERSNSAASAPDSINGN